MVAELSVAVVMAEDGGLPAKPRPQEIKHLSGETRLVGAVLEEEIDSFGRLRLEDVLLHGNDEGCEGRIDAGEVERRIDSMNHPAPVLLAGSRQVGRRTADQRADLDDRLRL